ncbi:hypothetical protein BpHYR1_047080 [Brachionus plicatilis]|uniref:Uncharacterized protein n=1 Tax=Brachionus plicatilis TaxID=10195 RepID=A0A3M7QV40_BRAPC|nr:hypothetical protein BpHYR1_047080 [Brachionus plicatilis]
MIFLWPFSNTVTKLSILNKKNNSINSTKVNALAPKKRPPTPPILDNKSTNSTAALSIHCNFEQVLDIFLLNIDLLIQHSPATCPHILMDIGPCML